MQEETSSFVSYVPKRRESKERKIANVDDEYYVFLKDPDFAVGNSLRVSSYAPFPIAICFNGHNSVAQYLNKRGVDFQMRDNLFVAVDDQKMFRRAIAAYH